MKLRYGDRVTVDWLDANIPSVDGWITLDDLSLVERGMTAMSTGFVIDRRIDQRSDKSRSGNGTADF